MIIYSSAWQVASSRNDDTYLSNGNFSLMHEQDASIRDATVICQL
jgi:hypothetical protein